MDVDHPQPWQAQQIPGNELAVGSDHGEVWCVLTKRVRNSRVAEAVRLEHRHVVRTRRGLYRRIGDLLPAVASLVGLSHHERDLMARRDERLERRRQTAGVPKARRIGRLTTSHLQDHVTLQPRGIDEEHHRDGYLVLASRQEVPLRRPGARRSCQ